MIPVLIPPSLLCTALPCQGLQTSRCHCCDAAFSCRVLLFSLCLKYSEQCLWECGASDGHKFLLERERPIYFSGYVSVAKDAVAAVRMEQSCIKLFGVGDDKGVFKATQGSLGLCCLMALLDPQLAFLHLGNFMLSQLQCEVCPC